MARSERETICTDSDLQCRLSGRSSRRRCRTKAERGFRGSRATAGVEIEAKRSRHGVTDSEVLWKFPMKLSMQPTWQRRECRSRVFSERGRQMSPISPSFDPYRCHSNIICLRSRNSVSLSPPAISNCHASRHLRESAGLSSKAIHEALLSI